MSVINNVLKDLESQASQFTPIDIAAVSSTKPVDQSASNRPLFLALIGISLAAVGFWYYQNQINLLEVAALPIVIKKVEAVEQSLPVVVAEPEAIPNQIIPSQIIPNQIIGLQIKESDNDVRLEFSLREKAVSYLKERSETRFVYHLKNIESEIVAPIIKDNRWIRQFSITSIPPGIEVAVQTVKGVLVNTGQIQKQDEAIWTIQLKKLPDPVVVEKAENMLAPVIKTKKPVAEPVSVSAKNEVSEKVIKPIKVDIKSSNNKISDRDQMLRTKDLIKNREWQKAEALLLSLMDGPQDLAARKQLLGIYVRPEYIRQYTSLARQSSDLYPDNKLLKTEYARALFQNQSYRSVITLLQAQSESNSRQLALIAASYQRLDEHSQAIEYYRQSLKQNRQQGRNWIGLGISLEHNGQPKLALQSYQEAEKIGNFSQRLDQFINQRSRLLKKVIN